MRLMQTWIQKTAAGLAAMVLAMPGVLRLPAQSADSSQSGQPQARPQSDNFVLKANAELVLTNIIVRDSKTGEFVRGLKQSDFNVYENGKQQQISSFDFQSVEMAMPLNEATISGLAAGGSGNDNKAAVVARPEQLRNHRLIVMFFDLTSMQPEDLDRCVDAARNYINKQMQPADIVALVSLSTSLSLDQDFTSDKKSLLHGVGRYNGSEGQGFAQGDNGTATNTSEDA